MQGRYGQNGPQAHDGARTTSDLHLAWDVPYEPGTLRAVGTKNGQTVATAEISTTGDPAAIELTVDRASDPRRSPRRGARHGQSGGRAGPHVFPTPTTRSPSRCKARAR